MQDIKPPVTLCGGYRPDQRLVVSDVQRRGLRPAAGVDDCVRDLRGTGAVKVGRPSWLSARKASHRTSIGPEQSHRQAKGEFQSGFSATSKIVASPREPAHVWFRTVAREVFRAHRAIPAKLGDAPKYKAVV